MTNLSEAIREINENLEDLGADLVLLESLLFAIDEKRSIPERYVGPGMKRLRESIQQHANDIIYLSGLAMDDAPEPTVV